MSGVIHPITVGVPVVTTVLGEKITARTLPFTGFAFGTYLAIALSLILIGALLRFVGRAHA